MRKIKEVLRLHSLGLAQRQIARSCSIGQSTVSEYLKAAETACLKWPDVADWDDARIAAALLPGNVAGPPRSRLPEPDYTGIQAELQKHKHLTLQLVWEEYQAVHPDGYGYSRYVAGKDMLCGSLVARAGRRAALATRNISLERELAKLRMEVHLASNTTSQSRRRSAA
jgi:transposase